MLTFFLMSIYPEQIFAVLCTLTVFYGLKEEGIKAIIYLWHNWRENGVWRLG